MTPTPFDAALATSAQAQDRQNGKRLTIVGRQAGSGCGLVQRRLVKNGVKTLADREVSR